jgi:hypothetical protein
MQLTHLGLPNDLHLGENKPFKSSGTHRRAAKIGLAAGLAQATSALLGAAPAFAGDKSWNIDTAVLFYSETDRVSAVEPVISATKTLEGDRTWNIKLVVDTLTGATPSGASPSDQVQTFTSPSGEAFAEIPAGEIPLDDSFKDTRGALSTQYVTPLTNTLKFSGGVAYSQEYDYQSFGINANLAKDFNQRNTTLSAGLALASDTVKPVGGKPIPLAEMQLTLGDDSSKDGADDSKTVTDFLVGVTQVISPTWLAQFNYSLTQQSGYLNDPYKVVSLLDSTGLPESYRYESRPDSRTKHSLFLRSKSHHGKDNVLDVSYRYHTDDWGIDSHTIDTRFRWQLNEHNYLEPHLRYYQQSAADFYTQGLDASLDLPVEASADSRLGEFTGLTFGAKYGYLFDTDKEINFRIESYQQTGDNQILPGDLQNRYDIYPDLDAIIVQVGYSFKF